MDLLLQTINYLPPTPCSSSKVLTATSNTVDVNGCEWPVQAARYIKLEALSLSLTDNFFLPPPWIN